MEDDDSLFNCLYIFYCKETLRQNPTILEGVLLFVLVVLLFSKITKLVHTRKMEKVQKAILKPTYKMKHLFLMFTRKAHRWFKRSAFPCSLQWKSSQFIIPQLFCVTTNVSVTMYFNSLTTPEFSWALTNWPIIL